MKHTATAVLHFSSYWKRWGTCKLAPDYEAVLNMQVICFVNQNLQQKTQIILQINIANFKYIFCSYALRGQTTSNFRLHIIQSCFACSSLFHKWILQGKNSTGFFSFYFLGGLGGGCVFGFFFSPREKETSVWCFNCQERIKDTWTSKASKPKPLNWNIPPAEKHS